MKVATKDVYILEVGDLDPLKIRRIWFDSLKCHIISFKAVLG